MNTTAITIFIGLFTFIAVLGFVSARWKRGDLSQLHEWGLGGRRFGSWLTWFLVGGDLYTAYTFIAVPALVFSAGAFGFFAIPYTVLVYPLAFAVLPRLWALRSISSSCASITNATALVVSLFGNVTMV